MDVYVQEWKIRQHEGKRHDRFFYTIHLVREGIETMERERAFSKGECDDRKISLEDCSLKAGEVAFLLEHGYVFVTPKKAGV